MKQVALLCFVVALVPAVAGYQVCRNINATRVSPNPLITGDTIGVAYSPSSSPSFMWPSFFYPPGWVWDILPNSPFPGVPRSGKNQALAIGAFGTHDGSVMWWGWTSNFLDFTLSSANSGQIQVAWSNGAITGVKIGSPDFLFEPSDSSVWMYFRVSGVNPKYQSKTVDGTPVGDTAGQATLAAKWDPVANKFIVQEPTGGSSVTPQAARISNAAIAPYYFRSFVTGGKYYALAKEPQTEGNGGSYLMTSITGTPGGPYGVIKEILDNSRHTSVAIRKTVDGKSHLNVGLTKFTDIPETALVAIVDVTDPNPMNWDFDSVEEFVILTPYEAWEGAGLEPATPSGSAATTQINGLRDPCLFYDKKGEYRVAYLGGGEYAIGIANLQCLTKPTSTRKMLST